MHRLTARLASLHGIGQLDLIDQADTAADSAERTIRGLWRQLVAAIPQTGSYSHTYHQTLPILQKIGPAISTNLKAGLRWLYHDGRTTAIDLLAANFPKPALKRIIAAPLLEAEPVIWSDQLEPLREPALDGGDEHLRRLFVKMLFPPPPEDAVTQWLTRLTRPWDTPAIGDQDKRLPEDLAALIARGVSQGLEQREVAKSVLPYLEGSRVRARRAARTFGIFAAHEGQMQAHEQLGELVIAYQIHATLDQNTRPEHAHRNGRIYYKRPEPGQFGLDQMPRPPLEADGSTAFNCRCFLTPVLSADPVLDLDPAFVNRSGHLIPDLATYDQWFTGADLRRRRMAVGARRYALVEDQANGEPVSWADFVDPDTGSLVPMKALADETPLERFQRRQDVQKIIATHRTAINRTASFGSVLPGV